MGFAKTATARTLATARTQTARTISGAWMSPTAVTTSAPTRATARIRLAPTGNATIRPAALIVLAAMETARTRVARARTRPVIIRCAATLCAESIARMARDPHMTKRVPLVSAAIVALLVLVIAAVLAWMIGTRAALRDLIQPTQQDARPSGPGVVVPSPVPLDARGAIPEQTDAEITLTPKLRVMVRNEAGTPLETV